MMKRLFIGIQIPYDEAFLAAFANLRTISNKLDKINWIEPNNLHITLKFLGATTSTLIPTIEDNIASVSSNISPFTITLNRIGIFGNRHQIRVIWIGVNNRIEEIDWLHEKLEKQMQTIGYKNSFGNFVPHATLGRVHSINNKRKFWEQFEKQSYLFNFSFQVKEIILFETLFHKPHTPEYKIVKKIALKNN